MRLSSRAGILAALLLAGQGDRRWLVDIADQVGLRIHVVSGEIDKRWILERPGSGACLGDLDGDGDPEVYVVNGARLEGDFEPNRMYRNDGGRFTDITAASRTGDRGWGGGCVLADFDGDADLDLFIANYGPDRLYRNDGGAFTEVSAAAGVADPRWGVGVAAADIEGDGDLDLFVANHCVFDHRRPAHDKDCRWKGLAVSCGPLAHAPAASVLYRNDGALRFTDITERAGMSRAVGYAFQPLFTDLDQDGDPDLFVAHDMVANQLWVNRGDGTFVEQGLVAGVALAADGRPQACMGADAGDVDGDGDLDLVVTNFSDDYNTLYLQERPMSFVDASAAAGLLAPTYRYLGWGLELIDIESDGDLDLFIANGHIWPEADHPATGTSYAQRPQLFLNDGAGRFSELAANVAGDLQRGRLGRGAAQGDLDGDGDLDLLVVNLHDRPALLRNDAPQGAWLRVRLRGRPPNTGAIGALVRLHAGGRIQLRERRLTSGYLGQDDEVLHFGLGDLKRVDQIEVRWMGGQTTVMEIPTLGRVLTLDQPVSQAR